MLATDTDYSSRPRLRFQKHRELSWSIGGNAFGKRSPGHFCVRI